MGTSTTPNMTLVIPDDHEEVDLWGAILNTVFGLIDAHDHTTGKGVPVPSAALRINADVAWSYAGTNYAITAAKALDFTPVAVATVASYSSALFANSDDSNNLYYRNSSGTNVKITDGATVNIAIAGGIGGDYVAVGALLDYDDASDTYRHRQEVNTGVRQWGRIAGADLDLYEYDAPGDVSVPANRVRISSPDALAASYALTLPAAAPASNGLFLQGTTAGALSFSNTTAQAITSSGVVTGTDFVFTSDQESFIPAAAAETTASGGTGPGFDGTKWVVGTTTSNLVYPFLFSGGTGATPAILTGYVFYYRKTTNATQTLSGQAIDMNNATGATGTTGMGGAFSTSANAPGYASFVVSGLTKTIESGHSYYFRAAGSGAASGDEFLGMSVFWKRA